MIRPSKRKKRNVIAPQSVLRRLGALELKLELVRNQGDELRIRGLSLGVGHGVAKELLQGVQIAPIPHNFDGVADGTLYPTGRGAEGFRNLGIQHLGDGIGVLSARLGALPDAAGEPYND